MTRIPVLLGTFLLCGLLVGCGNDSHDILVSQTVSLINEATTETGSITSSVKKAVEKAEGDKNKLDLTEAVKAADPLKKTGEKLQELKQRVENVRGAVSADEQTQIAEANRGKILASLDGLNEARNDLQKVLKQAEAVNKKKTDELRTRIREAEAPYEAIARQGQ